MTSKRKRYSADFKAKVALGSTAWRFDDSLQLATKHGIHPTMVGEWKKQAMDGLTAAVFSDRSAARESGAGRLKPRWRSCMPRSANLVVERDFLVKASGR